MGQKREIMANETESNDTTARNKNRRSRLLQKFRFYYGTIFLKWIGKLCESTLKKIKFTLMTMIFSVFVFLYRNKFQQEIS